eukprot:gnl/Trimastix_PCT/481.p2 GENE.gnl/Trimastix_PCT/481~~gnl/Trimastix_PCT/481.p2  ORF type:complete len:125 (+),score=25.47 gnl/Trimastix_PCT/481:44-418(+)
MVKPAFANPAAGKRLTKKLLKLVQKTPGTKIRRGVKEVTKALRKGDKGICIIATDISPVDVISHLPVYCETNEVPYIYVPSKIELGVASSTKRPSSCSLVIACNENRRKYPEVLDEVKALAPVY